MEERTEGKKPAGFTEHPGLCKVKNKSSSSYTAAILDQEAEWLSSGPVIFKVICFPKSFPSVPAGHSLLYVPF